VARPRSEEKRNTLLNAATQVFAEKGLSAPTAAITSAAGVAEGTLFVYFKGKDELINTLYEEIKKDLADAMLIGYPAKGSVRDRTKHVWDNYVEWGAKNPDRLALLHKLKVWEGIDPEVREAMNERFCELYSLTTTAIEEGVFQDLPHEFLMAMLGAQAETTIQFMRKHPKESDSYKKKGFDMFWNGIAVPKR
jgi:AcrR family transcriptional regulator